MSETSMLEEKRITSSTESSNAQTKIPHAINPLHRYSGSSFESCNGRFGSLVRRPMCLAVFIRAA